TTFSAIFSFAFTNFDFAIFLISFSEFILFHLMLQEYHAFIYSLFDFCLRNINLFSYLQQW
ncbi:MAG: hypothetical protein ACI4EX_13125, partial [Lachnospiraceae bacterium]